MAHKIIFCFLCLWLLVSFILAIHLPEVLKLKETKQFVNRAGLAIAEHFGQPIVASDTLIGVSGSSNSKFLPNHVPAKRWNLLCGGDQGVCETECPEDHIIGDHYFCNGHGGYKCCKFL